MASFAALAASSAGASIEGGLLEQPVTANARNSIKQKMSGGMRWRLGSSKRGASKNSFATLTKPRRGVKLRRLECKVVAGILRMPSLAQETAAFSIVGYGMRSMPTT